ncbi:hypothetical protein BJ875DRAFT_34771 [Amylocarpus encephaloides]|uniref:DUF8035 domain-containing protein n=1 Tax=Amylocarpus encephaloides TaxID=45428 RepID=A0A9P8C4L8_9HELO|nr:hypothetical protein BJ875DRAFT_34771 [Amylocarpus encephaloides]
MVFREDNMKFLTSMKFERLKPVDFRGDGQSQSAPPHQSELARTSSARPEQPLSLVPQGKLQDEKNSVYFDGSESDSVSESDTSSITPEDESKGAIIRTSDLLALNGALQVRQAIMPSSLGSSLSYGDNYERRSIEYSPQNSSSLASSPSQAMSIPIRSLGPGTSSRENFSASPRSEVFRLAPDSQGNQIPTNAKWTKINRRLVSPEVLDQDRRRYEAFCCGIRRSHS